MSDPNTSRLTGHDLAFVLGMASLAIGIMEWKALDAGVDGIMFAAAVAAVVAIAAFAVGRALPR